MLLLNIWSLKHVLQSNCYINLSLSCLRGKGIPFFRIKILWFRGLYRTLFFRSLNRCGFLCILRKFCELFFCGLGCLRCVFEVEIFGIIFLSVRLLFELYLFQLDDLLVFSFIFIQNMLCYPFLILIFFLFSSIFNIFYFISNGIICKEIIFVIYVKWVYNIYRFISANSIYCRNLLDLKIQTNWVSFFFQSD